ncbi:MAG: ABC transporter ATP-binding protein [Candidatus Delongbacteria bacterium]|nr:ABC transporter ATP-binding protein [Candidatus Delongbacteria bacterium]
MKSVRFLWSYILRSKKHIILGVVFTLLMSIVSIFPGVIYKIIADSLTKLTKTADKLNIKVPVKIPVIEIEPLKFSVKDPERIFSVFVLICVLFVIIYILDGLFRYLRDIYFNFAIQKILKEIKDAVCGKILALPYSEFTKNRTGDLMSRVTYDVTILHNVIDIFIELSRSLISLMIFCPILFYINFKVSLIAFLFFPASFYIIRYFSRKMKILSKGISDTTADYTEFLKDKAERNAVIKLAGSSEQELNDFKSLTKRKYELAVRNIKIKFFLKPSNEIIGVLGIAVIAIYFCRLLLNKEMGAGNIVLYISVLKEAYKPFKKVAESIGDLNFSLAGADKIVKFLENPEERQSGENIRGSINEIELRNVSLSFGDKKATGPHSMIFKKGLSYGITGPSGSGKTSLSNLIPGLYTATSGTISFNGKPLNDISLSDIRKRISFVNNEHSELSGTLSDIMSYGVTNAAEKIGELNSNGIIEGFLDIEGYDPDLKTGKEGIRLSSGQVQKLLLVNAILKEPEIIIIDESLDLLAENDVDTFFKLIRKDIILIIISRQERILSRFDTIINF